MKNYTANEFLEIAEYGEDLNTYFVDADGDDITITIGKDDACRNYGLRGDKYGSITVTGDSSGSAYRIGSGEGSAYRIGSGEGSAYRIGSGSGSACRDDSGSGDASRIGSGEGSAYRYGSGKGSACRDDSGNGSAFRDGSGKGSAYRDGLGKGSAYRYGIEIKSEEAKMKKTTEKKSDEQTAYLATCTLWLTENAPLREELAYRDGHRAGWANAIKEVCKLIDGKVLS